MIDSEELTGKFELTLTPLDYKLLVSLLPKLMTKFGLLMLTYPVVAVTSAALNRMSGLWEVLRQSKS